MINATANNLDRQLQALSIAVAMEVAARVHARRFKGVPPRPAEGHADDQARMAWEDELWRAWIKEVADPKEQEFKSQLLRLFAEWKSEILNRMDREKALTKINSADAELWVFGGKTWRERFQREGLDLLEGVAVTSGRRAFGQLPVVGVGFDVRNSEVTRLLNDRSIAFSKSVVGTTEKQLRGLLSEGIDAGEGMRDLRGRISGYFEGDTIKNRAELISRTETIWASGAGSVSAWRQSGVVEGKEWITASDERTCEVCLAAEAEFGEGKGISLDKPFYEEPGKSEDESYDTIEWPPRHPRCRCVLVPVLMEGAGEVEGWKPTMTEEEADEWGKDSKIKDELFHATDDADEIMEGGFRLDVPVKNGRANGDGVYLAKSFDTGWYGVDTLTARVNVKNPLTFREVSSGAKIPGEFRGVARGSDFGEIYSCWSWIEDLAAEFFPKLKRSEGIAAVLKEMGVDCVVDDRQWCGIVVFDPRNVTIVKRTTT